MSLEIQIHDFTADELCDLLLQDDRAVTDIIAHALKQSIHEMAGLDTSPSTAEVLRQLKRVAHASREPAVTWLRRTAA